MTYRNDHDAALARVDALQLEVAELRKQQEVAAIAPPSAPAAKPRTFTGAMAIHVGLSALMIGGIITSALYEESHAKAAEHVATLDTRVNRAMLDRCIDAIAPSPDVGTHYVLTRPDIVAIEHSTAPCDISAFRHVGLWSPTERAALAEWIRAEDQLSNSVSLISVYYSEAPEVRDGYASARQLWVEYARARTLRDAAIAHWRSTY